jgi:hypothetical protein
MDENCGGGQGLHWAVEPRREKDNTNICLKLFYIITCTLHIKSNIYNSV